VSASAHGSNHNGVVRIFAGQAFLRAVLPMPVEASTQAQWQPTGWQKLSTTPPPRWVSVQTVYIGPSTQCQLTMV